MDPRYCWMCGVMLDEDEIQYCSPCELAMLQELLAETEETSHENI